MSSSRPWRPARQLLGASGLPRPPRWPRLPVHQQPSSSLLPPPLPGGSCWTRPVVPGFRPTPLRPASSGPARTFSSPEDTAPPATARSALPDPPESRASSPADPFVADSESVWNLLLALPPPPAWIPGSVLAQTTPPAASDSNVSPRDAATPVTLPVPSPAQTRTDLCSPTPLLSRLADSWNCRLRSTLASSPPAHECQPCPSLWHLPFRRRRILSCCGHLRSLFLRRLPFLFLLSPRRHPRDCVCALPLARERSPHFPRGHSTLVPTSFACKLATLGASSPTSTSTLHLPYNFDMSTPTCKLLPALSPLASKETPLPIDQTRPQSLLQDAGVAERHTLF